MMTQNRMMMDTEFTAVTNLVSKYFDGLYHSETSLLAEIFHPAAHYVCATDGTVLYLTMNEYFSIVDRRPSPASRGETRNDRIVSIEFAGPVTALARVECSIGTKFFTDFLTLIFVDSKWQIISKVFHYDIRNDSV